MTRTGNTPLPMTTMLSRLIHRIASELWPAGDQGEIRRLRRSLKDQPRFAPGRVTTLGWDLEYADAPSLISCLEWQVLRRQNGFTTTKQAPYIIDAGANIGVSVLAYKRSFPKARIIAFEPDPGIFQMLRRNLDRNNARDVEAIQAAVWTSDGEASFFSQGADGGKLTKAIDDQTIKVPTVSLSKFLQVEVDLLKMDIEGAEYAVMPTLLTDLARINNLSVECHFTSSRVAEVADLLKLLATAGYKVTINTYGIWRDLIQNRPTDQPGWDQYALVSAWR